MEKIDVKFEANYLVMDFDKELTIATYGEFFYDKYGLADRIVVEYEGEALDIYESDPDAADRAMFEDLKPRLIEEAKELDIKNVILVFDWDGSEVTL